MEIFATILTDKFSVLQNFWKKSQANTKNIKFYGTDKAENLYLGGLVIIIDWENKRIIKKKHIKTPTGFDFKNNYIYVNTAGNSVNKLSKNLSIKQKIVNPLLNDIHSLNITAQGSLLIASTGLDSFIELNNRGRELSSWSALEHGYNTDPKGRPRSINKNINHRYKKYPTLRQTTHLNSAIQVGKTRYYKETIYCSLFHQGKILAVDKSTGKSKTILRNLNHPHSIYYINKNIVLSDTANNQVIISDINLQNKKIIKLKECDWIQDASILENKNLLISDANNNRIIEVNPKTKKIISEFKFNKEWRIYQAKQIK